MRHTALATLLAASAWHAEILQAVRGLGLPDGWIGAGFVRNAVWDHQHGRAVAPASGDVDVIWFDADRAEAGLDRDLEAALRARMPLVAWSVKNQARMHGRNADAPYASCSDAMRHWPETATAIAARVGPGGAMEIAAPFGLDDLFSLTLRPTPRFARDKHDLFLARVHTKRWLELWPGLKLQPES